MNGETKCASFLEKKKGYSWETANVFWDNFNVGQYSSCTDVHVNTDCFPTSIAFSTWQCLMIVLS